MRPLATAFALSCAAAFCCAPALAKDAPEAEQAGTVLQGSQPALPVSPHIGPAKALKAYRVPAGTFEVQLGPAKRSKQFVEHSVRFPSIVRDRWADVTGLYFAPAGLPPGQKVPAAVVVHHLGGSFDAEILLAKHLAKSGIAAFFIELPNYGQRQEKGTRQGFMRAGPMAAIGGFRQAVLDVIRASDFLRARPEVDEARVGAVGISLGAFVTSVAKGVDPRLRRTVLLLGGGGLHNMLKGFPESKNLLEHLGISAEDLGVILRDVDPITFADRVHPADVLMVNARQDEIVPPKASELLWEAYGRPQIHWFQGGHYGLLDHLPDVLHRTTEHLRGRSAF